MEPAQEQRRSPHRSVSITARCRTQSGMRDHGELADISTHGCCVITPALYLMEGTRIMIRPEGMEPITGVVVWVEGNRAGVSFDRPLYEPVVDHLRRVHSAV